MAEDHDGSREASSSPSVPRSAALKSNEHLCDAKNWEEEECLKTQEDDSMTSLDSIPDHRKPAILQVANLMQLLADAITYSSPLDDIAVILKCGAKVNAPVKILNPFQSKLYLVNSENKIIGYTNRGLRPLHYAVYVDYLDCVRLLIERGADVNATDDIGYTPIHLCARKGNIKSMKILIEEGATVDFFADDDKVDENSRALGYLTVEPLNLAIENNHVNCVKLLLESGAKPDHRYFMGYEINLVPLDHLECLKVLLQYGADPNVFNRCGVSPLMKACKQQNLQAARMLLTHGALVDLQCPPRFDRKTALHFAIASGNAALVHVLLRHGASTRRPEEYKYSALHSAVIYDRPDICDMLLKWGAKVDESSDENATPLMIACATRGLSKQSELVQLLLERGASVNASSGYVTFTSPAYLCPLVECLRNMENDVSPHIIQLLITYGAKVHFTAAATNVRVIDPCGVLCYLSHLQDKEDVMQMLISNATIFDADGIRKSPHLSTAHKIQLLRLSASPLELRRVVRLMLREILSPNLPLRVQALPVPTVVQNFLLTG